MLNINFIPEDYIRNNESSRTNLIYIVLLGLVMGGLISAFVAIKIRQRTYAVQEKNVDMEMARKQEALKQFEELQVKSSVMWKTALTTAELLEPAPRSVILASLTNNLPAGTSLTKLSIIQRLSKNVSNASSAVTSKYDQLASKNKQQGNTTNNVSPEQMLETYVEIEGMAPSDIQVADYIKKLGGSNLFDNVALVESKELKTERAAFRQFKLNTLLNKGIHITKEDVEKIRAKL